MKKYLVLLLALILLLQAGMFAAVAEGGEDTTTVTTTTTTAVGGSEETTTTTTQTGESEPSVFTASAEAVVEGDLLKITYTASDDAVPTALVVAGDSYALSVDAENAVATMKYADLPLGAHAATLMFAEGTCAVTYPARTGEADTLMQIRGEGNNVIARLYFAHNRKAIPVVGATISIKVDGREYNAEITDENGEAEFPGVLISQKESQVTCVFVECTVDGVTYKGCAGKVTLSTVTTTQTTTTTTGDGETRPTTPTTAPSRVEGNEIPTVTYPTVFGSLSTSASADTVLTDVILDTELLSAFGLADAAALSSKVKASVPKSLYEQLATAADGALFVKMLTSPIPVSGEMLAAAVSSEAALQGLNAENSVMVTYSFGLQAVGSELDREVNLGKSDAAVTVELPIPASMSACTKFFLLKTGVTSLLEAQALTANNGTIALPMAETYTYTLVAFYDAEGSAPTEPSGNNEILSILSIVLVVGIVIFVVAALLLYWPQIRVYFGKEKPAGAPIPEELEEKNDQLKVLPPEPMAFPMEFGDLPEVQVKSSDDE